MKEGEGIEDVIREARAAGFYDDGATLGIMVEDGVAKAMSDAPVDIAAAKGMQAWLDSSEPGNPNLYVFKAVLEAGITKLNDINLVEAVAELEAEEKARAEARNTPMCQAAAGMYVYAFGMVASVLEDVASHAMENGEVTQGLRYIMARSAIVELGERAAKAYHGLPIEADTVHDLFVSLGLHCPDKDGSEDTSYTNGDRNTGPFHA